MAATLTVSGEYRYFVFMFSRIRKKILGKRNISVLGICILVNRSASIDDEKLAGMKLCW